MAKEQRKRNWAFVVYPESAPGNWREILHGMLVPGFVSPLHDSDVNADGEEKKAHHHVILTFKGLKSYAQVKEITDQLNAPAPQECKDVRAYARYLCHLDNPEKAQYQVSDVECLGGADYLEKIKCAADTDTALGEMMDWCIEEGCFSFFRLSNYARHNRSDWFRVITSSRTVFLTAWLKSMQWELNGQPSVAMRGHEHHEDESVKCCPECGSIDVVKHGKTPAGTQRYTCRECNERFT